MLSILCFSEPAVLHSEWQFDLLFCVVRPVGSVDSNGSLEELDDALVDPLSKVLREVRPDVSQPVVSHELKAYYRQYL